MDDVEVAKLADVVSARVFEAMSKFVGVLEGLVRENEALRSKVEHLEFMVYGPDDLDEDEEGDLDWDDGPCGDENCLSCRDPNFWGPEEDDVDGEPTFD